MEIISYVGSRPRGHKNGFAFPDLFLKRRSHIGDSGMSAVGVSGLTFVPRKIRHRMAVRTFSLTEMLGYVGGMVDVCVHNIWLFFIFCLSLATPFVVGRMCSYMDSFAHPLPLENVPAQELEVLNKAMAAFALDSKNEFDADGNILNDDGTVLKPSDVSFRQPVSYRNYTVVSGDTLLGITRKFGLTNISTLISVNAIDNVRQLRFGQKIRIPSTDGIVYTVRHGDTLTGLSLKLHVPLEDLLDVNDLSSHVLATGRQLFIPGARLSSDELSRAMGELFRCPLSSAWRLTSPFGPRPDPFTGVSSFHTGIDMAVPKGTPIKAAMSGKVIAVGYSNVFGNYVIINHGNGYQTLYGHMSRLLAHTGERVNQGTRIGLVGSTGYSTGPHLHFTVYKNGKLIDPLSVLK